MVLYDKMFFEDNIKKVNRMIEKIIFLTCIVPIIFIVFSLIGIWGIDYKYSVFVLSFTFLASIVSFLLNRHPKTQVISMYVSMFLLTLFVFILGSSSLIIVRISFALVPFLTCLYFNKRFTFTFAFINMFMLIISCYIRSFGVLDELKLSLATYNRTSWFISSTASIILECLFLVIIVYFVVNKTHDILQEFITLSSEKDSINDDLKQVNLKLKQSQTDIVEFIPAILKSHDFFAGQHVVRSKKYVGIIAREMQKMGFYPTELTDKNIKLYETASLLHDIGKIHIPENILNKPGKFTEQEYELMKLHTTEGLNLLQLLPVIENGELNSIAENMAYYHHEKWNGHGYPTRRSGYDIPLCARIMAAADLLDAVVSQRLYKNPITFDAAMDIFLEEDGKSFDPLVVKAVLSCRNILEAEAQKFKELETSQNKIEFEKWREYNKRLLEINSMLDF